MRRSALKRRSYLPTVGDRRKFGGARARAVFSRPFSDQGWTRGLDLTGCEFQAPQKCLRLISVYAINFMP
jgi:hypothetical protein